MISNQMFDIKDSALVTKMFELIEAQVPFTLKELASEVCIPYKTVERRVHRMKHVGLITSHRVGRRWLWGLTNMEQPIYNATSSRAFMVISGEGESSEKMPNLRVVQDDEPEPDPPKGTPIKPLKNKSNSLKNPLTFINRPFFEWHPVLEFLWDEPADNPTVSPSGNPQETPQLSNLKDNSVLTITEQQEYNSVIVPLGNDVQNRCSRGKEKSMPIVRGPESPLLKSIQEVLASPQKPRKKPNRVKVTPQTRLRQKMEEKEEAEYNVTDMRFVYEDLWTDKSWRTYPSKWTMKDKKLVRNLLDEQGGENTVRYFQYVVQGWEEIQQRYRIQGSPSVSVIWGFRNSLLHEALNGPAKQSAPTLEYEESSDTKDGSFI
jgi:hypothetical protein